MFRGNRVVVTLSVAVISTSAGFGYGQSESPDLAQVARLVPFVDLFEDSVRFGRSVAMDGDLMVVGAPGEDPYGYGANFGAAYVFFKAHDQWHIQAKLLPAGGGSFDEFGSSVAIDGLTVVVGAPLASGPFGDNQGAAYVFTRSGDGQWTETARLEAVDGGANENFGCSVGVSGDTVLVGA